MIAMIAVERIDQSRQTGRFACKSDAAAALVHQRGERLARIARRARPLEGHFVAIRLEILDPANEGRRTVEKKRLIEHADECDRQTNPVRMIQNLSAIVQRAIGNRRQPRPSQIFLLHIEKDDDRNAGRIGEGPKAPNGVHAVTLIAAEPGGGQNPGEKAPRVSIRVENPGFRPAMVVVRPIFWQE